MARFAPTCSATMLLNLLNNDPKGYLLGSYHLFIASEVLAYPGEYSELVSRLTALHRDNLFIILDNSAFELGHPLHYDKLHEAADIALPHCIVMPDSIGDAQATVRMSNNFITDWFDSNFPPVPMMGVVQGRTVPELMWCTTQLSIMPWVRYFGVPKAIYKYFGSRYIVQNILGLNTSVLQPKNVHLLGMTEDLQEDLSLAKAFGVMGIDSSAPIVQGLCGRQMHHKRADRPLDYFQQSEVNDQIISNLLHLRHVIG